MGNEIVPILIGQAVAGKVNDDVVLGFGSLKFLELIRGSRRGAGDSTR
jgi:hypothetical protein